MSLTRRISAGFILSLILFGFIAPSWASLTALIFIADIQGDVELKRTDASNYKKANLADLLDPSDQLKLDVSASAKIQCDNLDVKSVPAGEVSLVSDICDEEEQPITRPGPLQGTLRSPNDAIPYVISPRNTALINGCPTLHWNNVEGANNYTVGIRGGGLEWQTETSDTQIGKDDYPCNEILQPGIRYLVIVETDTGESSETEQGVSIRFNILDEEQVSTLSTRITQLVQHNLSPDLEQLARAHLYQDNNLNTEAIELLERLVQQGSQFTATYLLLGDLYLQVGLIPFARQPYLKGLELAQQSDDWAGQATLQAGLGEVEYSMGNNSEARRWLTNAKESYAILGNRSAVEELEEWINVNLR
ncbi:hypothetical protein Lepto7375DRAFT_0007 [Leptolyngbya sp. PCC 7375]|nr:hypothetical protein Lepto7375DRAFT_0007 [Leptolyngbya sp. PCC 7375]